jgi:quinol monooxygenase YgiN
MSLIAVDAIITIADPSKRQELIERTAPIQQATRDDEPGCLIYCFAADPCRDDVIQAYELWESAEDLAAHLVHANYFAMRATLGEGGLVGAVANKHRIDKTAPVYGPDRVATASFE